IGIEFKTPLKNESYSERQKRRTLGSVTESPILNAPGLRHQMLRISLKARLSDESSIRRSLLLSFGKKSNFDWVGTFETSQMKARASNFDSRTVRNATA
ncbi:MAG: hypothetical protein WBD33_16575, partial [Xanthobacteraceae bacterium]